MITTHKKTHDFLSGIRAWGPEILQKSSRGRWLLYRSTLTAHFFHFLDLTCLQAVSDQEECLWKTVPLPLQRSEEAPREETLDMYTERLGWVTPPHTLLSTGWIQMRDSNITVCINWVCPELTLQTLMWVKNSIELNKNILKIMYRFGFCLKKQRSIGTHCLSATVYRPQ